MRNRSFHLATTTADSPGSPTRLAKERHMPYCSRTFVFIFVCVSFVSSLATTWLLYVVTAAASSSQLSLSVVLLIRQRKRLFIIVFFIFIIIIVRLELAPVDVVIQALYMIRAIGKARPPEWGTHTTNANTLPNDSPDKELAMHFAHSATAQRQS